MRPIEIKVSVDLTNDAEREALNAFMAVLGGAQTEPSLVKVATPEPLKEEPKKVARPKQYKPVEEPIKEEPEQQPAAAPKSEPKQEEPAGEKAKEETTVTLLDLRKMVSERAAGHRDAMKAKLTELGAANVSTLDEDKYSEFHSFLLTLK